MSLHKTVINQEVVKNYLKNNFSNNFSDFEIIVGGEGSQAYRFNVGENKYIIRINKHHSLGFLKDEYAAKNFSNQNLPIPKIFQIGKIDNEYRYCISERAEGVTMNSLNAEDIINLTGELFDVLDMIHSVDVSDLDGFGKWGADGRGGSLLWRDRILNVDEYVKKTPEKYSLFENSFLDRELWDGFYNNMLKLIHYCSDDRYLIHGDYGFGNILTNGKRVTGVIDWEASMYGDFLFDIAWLGFWSRKVDYVALYKKRCEYKEVVIENYSERVRCYQIYIGLRTMSFYAYSGQKDKYLKLVKIIKQLL